MVAGVRPAYQPTAAELESTTRARLEQLAQDPRVRAMLDTIASVESNGRYDVMFGGGTVSDLSQHPGVVNQGAGLSSSAAGRYQFLESTWNATASRLGLPDFSPHSQDLAAIDLMQQRGMIEPLLAGDFATAIANGAPEWASLPTASGAGYYSGQNATPLAQLQATYNNALATHQGAAPPLGTPAVNVPAGTQPQAGAPSPFASPVGYGGGVPAGQAPATTVRDVIDGDTLWDIAVDAGMNVATLLGLPGNEGFRANPDLIYRGDAVNLPAQAMSASMAAPIALPGASGIPAAPAGSTTADPMSAFAPAPRGDAVSNLLAGFVRDGIVGQGEAGAQTTDLMPGGRLHDLLPTMASVDSSVSCANFVTAVLQQAGVIDWHENRVSLNGGVSPLESKLQADGWTRTSVGMQDVRNATPGDVAVIATGSSSRHVVMYAGLDAAGRPQFIGSNNNSDDPQEISYYSTNGNPVIQLWHQPQAAIVA